MTHQEERGDLGFGGSFEPVALRPPVESAPVPRSSRALAAKPWLLFAVLLIAAAAIFGFLKFVGSAGKQAADAERTVVAQPDKARDVEAEQNALAILTAARQGFADGGSFAEVGPQQLAGLEPVFEYTTGPSTGPMSASVLSTETTFAAAVKSASGTCVFIKQDPTGAKYGTSESGACTAQAAMSGALSLSWS